MFFLLKKDNLVLPYVVLQLVFLGIGVVPFLGKKSYLHVTRITSAPGYRVDGSPHVLFRVCVVVRTYFVVNVRNEHVEVVGADAAVTRSSRSLGPWWPTWLRRSSSLLLDTLTSTTTSSRRTRAATFCSHSATARTGSGLWWKTTTKPSTAVPLPSRRPSNAIHSEEYRVHNNTIRNRPMCSCPRTRAT